jgi:hypothetical protein
VEELRGHAGVLGLGGALVVLVDGEDGAVVGERVQLVRAGADRLPVLAQSPGVVLAVVDEGTGAGRDLAGEGGVGCVELEDDRLLVGVLTSSTGGNMTAGPSGSLIFSTRSKENFTSFEVSGSPLLDFSPSRGVQLQTVVPASAKPQLSAASGGGSVAPLRKPSSDLEDVAEQQPGGGVGGQDVVGHIPTTTSQPSAPVSPPSAPQPVNRPEASPATMGRTGHG